MPDVTSTKFNDILVLTVRGKVSRQDFVDAIARFCPLVERHLVWDLIGADLSEITAEEIQCLGAVSKVYRPLLPGAKTAYVTQDERVFGLTRKVAVYAEMAGSPVTHIGCLDLEEAFSFVTAEE
ncbi:hypothetical protein [Geomesophilobacter sediminis]|uniref:Uncharacterized protein n=1 Tax=Geomesophilobacter sediminis TaxID=2798584 RepID=A0A8J7LYD0_9BACT|nr:hypothetical protein [Geomesophilobacter sediminis]MBJ6724582.1 hypothetical protein [Geomesophilobacter sediminis]